MRRPQPGLIVDERAALHHAIDHDGPSLICVRTDHKANLNIPVEMAARFFEVYSGLAAATEPSQLPQPAQA